MWQIEKEDVKKRQNLSARRSCESLAMLEVSNEIAIVLAKKNKPFSDVENIFKLCIHIITKWVGDKRSERKLNKVALSKQTIIRHIEELPYDVHATEGSCQRMLHHFR